MKVTPGKFLLTITLLSTTLFFCTAVHKGRTIGKGSIAVESTFGGPILTNLNFPLPVPNLFVGGRYGLRDDLDLSVHYNLTAPVLPGIPLDLITAVHWVPIQPGIGRQNRSNNQGWGAGVSFDIQWLTTFKNSLIVLPTLELAGAFRYKLFNFSTGTSLGLNGYRIEDSESMLEISPFLGVEFISRKKLSIGIRFTAFDIIYNYNASQVDWIYVYSNEDKRKKYAPLGIAIGLGYQFKKSVSGQQTIHQ